MREVAPVTHKLGFPRVFCPVCAARYMRQLWVGCCVCSGDVELNLPMPGGTHEMRAAPVIEVAAVVVPPAEKKPRKASAKPAKQADAGSLF